ncbi:nucleic-acid-binding protein from transposon X-element [Trichonephila inaurata madagascariensis]|uniref:Nucleic-acid-binding protein from transposon X-element n=1 Tax=Trichonephila inaurata madagascariensis TaxID=2747483 RepID=A0A8X6X5B1_9ARAC|nr:nucleic-acid-binding protein from transposon X-element [Trichonephila inaurata madagascariensis]
MDTSSESNASSYPATPNAAIQPPNIDNLRTQLSNIRTSADCLQFCSTLDAHTQDLDSYYFDNLGSRNQYGVLLYSLLEQARSQYSALKDNECHLDVLKSWGRSAEGETPAFTPVVNRKQKSSSPRKEATSSKKQKTDVSNQFSLLEMEEIPENFDQTENPLDAGLIDHPSRTSTPRPRHRPPPPITIDNVEHTAQLLKRLQNLTNQKLQGRVIGRGLRVYPETPAAYHQIRNLSDNEKLEAFTHELSENKEIKVVIRGMPTDMPVDEIMEDLASLFIKPSECRIMTNKKTGLPMPLFLLSLPMTDDNKNIYHISELCNMKIKVEQLNKNTGPVQCFRCQGFFLSSRFCTRNPKCVKCGKPHLTRDCKKTAEEEPTCCHCQGNHPANFLGCPKNPLNKPPPPPKVNAWEERIKKRKELQEAAKRKAEQASEKETQPSATPEELNPTPALPSTLAKKPSPQPHTRQGPVG